MLARAELERGDPEAARAAIARARELLAGMSLPLMESTVVQAEALLALARAATATGPPSWPRAARPSPTASARWCTPRGCARWRARRCRGGRPRGRARAAQARRGASSPGSAPTGCAPRRRASCASSACASAGRQRRGARGEGLAALSGREREIAELVAQGRTNREIAAELFVSEKTVEGHLRNVFIKLEVSARAAVAEAVGRARADVE